MTRLARLARLRRGGDATQPWLPWLLLGASVAAKVATTAIVLATPEGSRSPDGLGFLVWVPGVLAFAIVGAVVASRRWDSPIGWLFLGVGLLEPIALLGESYARLALASPGLPAGGEVGIVGSAASTATVALVVLVILLFPSGTVPSPRWRPILWLVAGWAVALVGSVLLAAGPISEVLPVPNPLAGPGPVGELAATLASLEEPSSLPVILLSGAALLTRWRRAGAVERAQMKLFASSIALLIVVVVAVVPIQELAGPLPPAADALSSAFIIASIAWVPVSAGIAILRYRLFDIDVVIRRTLIYGALVAILGVVYAGMVLGAQAALAGATGNDTVPVALSTLAIAALFGPLRRRVRQAVDRRFYRSRYDARQTLEAMSGRLREQVDIDAVGRTLIEVAGQAVRPTSANVWLRERGR